MRSAERLNATFAALADPTRRAILARLAAGEASVLEIAKPFDMRPPATSTHLKVPEPAGLIERGRKAQWRPCRLAAAPLRDASDWIGRYRRFWGQSFDRLDGYRHEPAGKKEAKADKPESLKESRNDRNRRNRT